MIDRDISEENSFDKETFDSVLSNAISIRKTIQQEVSQNIQSAQKKQQRDYNRRHHVPNVLKIGQKVLLKNQKREDRKDGNFTYKWLGPYTVHAISSKNLCSLKNQVGKTLKKKYNISLLKPYVEKASPFDEEDSDSNDRRGTVENESVVTDERPAIDESFDSSLSKEYLPNVYSQNVWGHLPNELVEKILVTSVKSSKNAVHACQSVSRTCKRFNHIIIRKKKSLLPRVYITFTHEVLGKLPSWNGKIKVSVRKITQMFGRFSGVALSLSGIIDAHNWRSAWLILNPEEHSWYQIEKIYWKSCSSDEKDENAVTDAFWIKNDLYNLLHEDLEILRSKTSWLNDRIMDAAQQLICKELGLEFQSVLNIQKLSAPYHPVMNEHVQLFHDGLNHWMLTFCSNGRVQICDSMRIGPLNRQTKKSVDSLYKSFKNNGHLLISFLPVQKQPDGYNCGPFAVAFAAELVHGSSPIEAEFDVSKMRGHLEECLVKQCLLPFPKVK